MLVTGYSLIPQGTMPPKCERSGSTLIEKPCSVTQRRTRMPSAPIFASRPSRSSVQDADAPLRPSRRDAEVGQRRDHPAFEMMDEIAHVLAALSEVDVEIADPLSRPVIGIAPTPPGIVDGKARVDEFGGIGAGPGGVKRRMFQQPHPLALPRPA